MVWNRKERRNVSTRIEILEVVPETEWGDRSLPALPQGGALAAEAPKTDAPCRLT
jgi:hypothetical protein